jgi:uncharacterized protein with PIN domain
MANDLYPGLPDYVGPTKGWFTLLHHAAEPYEYSDDVIERITYIKENKPQNEVAIRLRHIVYVSADRPPLLAEYGRVTTQAWAEYGRVTTQAWAEYGRVKAQAWAEYGRVTTPALAEYQRIKAPALAEYQRVNDQAWAEYGRVKAPAWAEYQRVKAPALAAITEHLKSLIPDCKWDGTQIVFAEAAQS